MYRYLVTFHQCLQTHLELRMSLLLLDDTPLETPKTSYNCVCRPDVLLVTTKGRLHVKLIKHPFKGIISHISASKSLIDLMKLTAVQCQCAICVHCRVLYISCQLASIYLSLSVGLLGAGLCVSVQILPSCRGGKQHRCD